MVLEPLRSAEPARLPSRDSVSAAPREEVWVQETLDGAAHLAGAENVSAPREALLTSAQREARGQQVLGLTPSTVHDEVPEQVHRIHENARKAQEVIDKLRGTPQFAEDDDAVYLGAAWGNLARRDRDAIVQPPKPEVVPASAVLKRAQERRASREAEPA